MTFFDVSAPLGLESTVFKTPVLGALGEALPCRLWKGRVVFPPRKSRQNEFFDFVYESLL